MVIAVTTRVFKQGHGYMMVQRFNGFKEFKGWSKEFKGWAVILFRCLLRERPLQ
jgi:hypothetical protein